MEPSDPLIIGSETNGDNRVHEPVILNVYDMLWTNDYTRNMGFGVYHSGLEVYGREYMYRGHPYPYSGVFDIAPRQAGELREQFRFKESVLIGFTNLQPTDVDKVLDELGKEFRGDYYHLRHRNCNHFTGALSRILTDSDIPSWVNHLAYLFSTWYLLIFRQNSLNLLDINLNLTFS